MPIYITICDDCLADATAAKDVIAAAAQEQQIDVEFDFCLCAADAERRSLQRHEAIDILILDIDMPGMNGLELAQRLRQENQELLIIFLSAHEEFVYQAFESQPFRYIRKMCLQTEMPLALSAAFKVLAQRRDQQIVLQTSGGTVKESLSHVVYIEADRHNVILHLLNGAQLSARLSLSELQAMIPAERFVMIHRSCIVNTQHVKSIANGTITLNTDETLAVSRTRFKEVRQQLLRVWRDQL